MIIVAIAATTIAVGVLSLAEPGILAGRTDDREDMTC
jgi:hypothetical protein